MAASELSSAAARVQVALDHLGLESKVVELPASAHTASDAARAIGCRVDQIVKSLVFRGRTSGRPVLGLTSGAHRVDEPLISALVGEQIEKADADFVRRHTGFAIGGAAPIGHPAPLQTIVDADLLQHEELWAAAGTPHAVFRLTPEDLRRVSHGTVAVVAQS